MSPEQSESLQEVRLFAIAAPAILALLAKRKKVALELLMRDFRDGGGSNVARIAEITCLSDLERDITEKERTYNTLMEKQK